MIYKILIECHKYENDTYRSILDDRGRLHCIEFPALVSNRWYIGYFRHGMCHRPRHEGPARIWVFNNKYSEYWEDDNFIRSEGIYNR